MENQGNMQRPHLKKIKRPINRIGPQTQARPESQPLEKVLNTPQISQKTIDEYLDEPVVPAPRPSGKSFNQTQVEKPQYLSEKTYEEDYRFEEPSEPEWLTVKMLALISVLCLFAGVVFGKLLFAESKVVRNGLQGVVVNGEIPRGRARCGVAERAQGCVLYLMNPQRQEMRAKDFYDLAAQMTGRQRFMIETGNMRYANSKIKPGEIAQLNIPPL